MSYTHLTREERYQMWSMLCTGHSVREVDCALDSSTSTLSREVRGNSGRPAYSQKQALDLAAARAHNSLHRHRITAAQRQNVERLIQLDGSTQQIPDRARQEGSL